MTASSVKISQSSFVLSFVFDKVASLPRDCCAFVQSETIILHGNAWYVHMYIGGTPNGKKDNCCVFLYPSAAMEGTARIKLISHHGESYSICTEPLPLCLQYIGTGKRDNYNF